MATLVTGQLTCRLTGEKTYGREVGYCTRSMSTARIRQIICCTTNYSPAIGAVPGLCAANWRASNDGESDEGRKTKKVDGFRRLRFH
jgi:hypothetical protein